MTTIRNSLVTIAACLLATATAHSHTQLSGSNPADQAVLDAAPTAIHLSFSEAVRLTAVTIVSGDESTALTVNVADSAKEFDVELPKLAAGEYVVEWRALSEDTHVVTGTIRFSIAA